MTASGHKSFDTTFVALFIWLIGFLMSILGGHELATALQCGSEPAPITCADLAQHGPTGNHYVRLTDFEPYFDGSLHWTKQGGQLERIEVPLLVKDSDAPARVIVRDYHPGTWEDVAARLSAGELTGLVVGHGLFCQQDAAAFAGLNPGMNPAACWVVSLDKAPGNPSILGPVMAVGVVLFAVSIVLFVLKRPERGVNVVVGMSPLITFVEAMHSLAALLPLPSRLVRGAVLLPLGVLLASWAGYRYWLYATTPGGAAGMDAAFLPIILLDLGAAMAAVGLAFLVLDQPQSEAANSPPQLVATAGARSPGT